MEEKPGRLYRSKDNRVIAGVCGGLGEYFAIDPVVWRLVFVLAAFFGGSGLLAYIVLAIIVPEASAGYGRARETIRQNLDDLGRTAREFGDELSGRVSVETSESEVERRNRRRQAGGIILVVLGLMFMASNLNLFFWLRFDYVWPLLLIALGIAIMVGWGRR
ncbi:MAG: PspC domain-containing protein [Dehalococcoidales bacterium]|nr:PspC domain-containing protein [Dehalococcoidales bacterium]